MKLCELKSPFCRKKIITYASDHTTAVVRNRELQQIDGYLYKDRNKTDSYGQISCRLYVYYPEHEIGIEAGGVACPDSRTIENVLSWIPPAYLQGPDAAIAELDHAAANSGRIMNAQIELARHIAPEKVDPYTEARQRYWNMLNQKHEESRKKREAEDAAFCKEKNEKAQEQIDNAIKILRCGGTLDADFVSIFHSRYDCRSYNIINHLARMYGVKIPLKVQGWINSKLHQVTISDGRATRMRHSGRASQTFWGYMDQLIQAVCQEEDGKNTAA